MKLEVGKAYRMRNGEKVTLSSWDSPSHPFEGSNGYFYRKNGNIFNTNNAKHTPSEKEQP